MIKKINKISALGIIKGFRWTGDMPPFRKYNLIYGWNYSGKTTLSRMFRYFGGAELPSDYEDAEFEIEFDDNTRLERNFEHSKYQFRVFNSDYIKSNLKWNEQSLEPIFYLGEKNIELQKEAKKNKDKIEGLIQNKEEATKELTDLNDTIESSLTDEARQIKTNLNKPNFDKRNLRPIVDDIYQNPDEFLLDKEVEQEKIDTVRTTDKKRPISKFEFQQSDFKMLLANINEILNRDIVAKTIERLASNPKLNSWVKKGIPLHEDKVNCQFCGKPLPDGLMNKLQNHFSEDYDILINDIENTQKELLDFAFNIELFDASLLYNEFQEQYDTTKQNIIELRDNHNEDLQALKKLLDKKDEDPYGDFNHNYDDSKYQKMLEYIKELNRLIESHNSKSEEFEEIQKRSFQKLLYHKAGILCNKLEYEKKLKKRKNLDEEIEQSQESIEELEKRNKQIERELSDTVKGAEQINEYLQSFFGKNDILVEVVEEKQFKLKRGKAYAENLSEGEKTAISFAYFMANLKDRDTDLEKSIVFIDDPISSLDANHIYFTYALIKNELNNCHQLFISTHNLEFFNLVKEWFTDREHQALSKFYLIERIKSDYGETAHLSRIHKMLEKFKSEYHLLFSILYEFNNNPSVDFNYLYQLPNIIRRFLEAYLGFKYPASKGLKDKLNEYFVSDGVAVDKINKLIQEYSHNQYFDRSLHFTDINEVKEVVEIVLDAVKKDDISHYKILCEEVAN